VGHRLIFSGENGLLGAMGQKRNKLRRSAKPRDNRELADYPYNSGESAGGIPELQR
jgi:hypothetical protein